MNKYDKLCYAYAIYSVLIRSNEFTRAAKINSHSLNRVEHESEYLVDSVGYVVGCKW